MARAVLTIAGAAVGGFFGGPAGAALGAQLGGMLGNLVDPQKLEGPRLGDTNVRASTYGKAIPLVYGAQNRIGSNLIWSTGLNERKRKRGSKLLGTRRTEYTYSVSAAFLLGEGVLQNLDAIYCNGKILWSKESTLTSLAEQKARDEKQVAYLFNTFGVVRPLDPFLQNYSEATLFPDNTPWIAAPSVTYDGSGGGLFGDIAGVRFQSEDLERIEWFPGTTDQPVSPTIFENEPLTPAYRGRAYVVLRGLQLAKFGNSVPTVEFIVKGIRAPTIATVLTDMCQRSGLAYDEFVVRGHISNFPLRGYTVATAESTAAAVLPLTAVFPFDACEHAGVLRFTAREVTVRATIDVDEFGGRDQSDSQPKDPVSIERVPDLKLPALSALTYIDPENNFQPNTQQAQRVGGFAATQYAQTVAVVLSADEARTVVDRSLWEAWLTRETYRLRTGARFAWLETGNRIAIQRPGGYTLFRVISKDVGDNKLTELVCSREDRQAYLSAAPGGEPFVYDQQVPPLLDTIQVSFNAPQLYTSEDNNGFYVAVSGNDEAWVSADVFRSTALEGPYEDVLFSNSSDIRGGVTGTLANGPSGIWDRVNMLTVTLDDKTAVLSSLNEDDLLNSQDNRAWIGAADGSRGEVIQFSVANEVSDGVWELSTLLRGLRATEHETSLHTTGEVFILLDSEGMNSLDFGQAEWGRAYFHKAVTTNQAEEDSLIIQPFTGTGERKRPRSVVHGRGLRNVANDVDLSWVRRVRGFPPTLGRGAVPLDETSELYDLEILVGVTVVRTASVTAPAYTYTAAQQTTDGITPGNPVTFRVYQVSSVYGRGVPATFTV